MQMSPALYRIYTSAVKKVLQMPEGASSSEESDDESDTGERKRGRPKTRWKDVCKRDMQTVGLREGDEGDRAYWKETISNHSGDPR